MRDTVYLIIELLIGIAIGDVILYFCRDKMDSFTDKVCDKLSNLRGSDKS